MSMNPLPAGPFPRSAHPVRPRIRPRFLAGLLLLATMAAALAGAGCGTDDPARQDTLEAIARWQDARLAPEDSLQAALVSSDGHVRLAAVRAAGLIGRDHVIEAMIELLDDPSDTVRRQACISLGLLGSERAVPALTAAITDPHPRIRLAALRGLARLENDGEALLQVAAAGTAGDAAAAWDALRNTADRVDPPAMVAGIREGLLRPETDVQWRVLRCAELVPDSALVDVMEPLAGSADVQVRVHAYRALGRIQDPDALQAVLIGYQSHGQFKNAARFRVDISLYRALGGLVDGSVQESGTDSTEILHLGMTEAIATILIRGSQDANPHVAETALQAMAAIARDQDLPAEAADQESLLPVWRIRLARAASAQWSSPHVGVRSAAVTARSALRGTGAGPELSALLPLEKSPHVLAACLQAMGEIHPDPLMTLIQYVRADQMLQPGQEVRPALANAMVRTAALDGLVHLYGDRPESMPPGLPFEAVEKVVRDVVLAAAGDFDYVVAATAAGHLGGFPGPESLTGLLSLWARSVGEGRSDIRRGVLAGIQEMLEPPSEGQLDPRIHDTPDMALLREKVVELLRSAFDSPDIRIRLEGRQTALATGLLPDNLVPGEASLRATLPATVRNPGQPAVTLPFAAPRVRCVTDRGEFTITLDTDVAPNTCAMFLDLIGKGFYDQLTFHRVVPDFVIQGGDPRGNGWGGPGYMIRSEWSQLTYRRAMVGIAHDGKDTGGSQFFVTLSEQPHLNGRYTIFGEVTSGMDTVDKVEVGDIFKLEIVP